MLGGGGGEVDGGGQGGKPIVCMGGPKLGGVTGGEIRGAATVEID